jgi:hypothetical protein
MLAAFGHTKFTEVTSYTGQTGYGLYIFNNCSPDTMPTDGAVWFINPTGTTANAGFTYNGVVGDDNSSSIYLKYGSSSNTVVTKLLSNVFTDSEIGVKKYADCTATRTFSNLLFAGTTPVLFAGTNSYGNREVVFAFDLHESDLALSINYVILANNLLNYTFPPIIDTSFYYCGDTVEINVLTNCDSIRVDTPDGNYSYLNTGNDIVEYSLTETGVYTLTMMVGNAARQVNFYSAMPIEERATTVSDSAFIISGNASDEKRDGRYDDLIVIFILLAVIVVADWMVYCYEQYQLR